MLDFTHILHIEGKGYFYVTFSFINTPQKMKFHVTILTRERERYHFNMDENYGQLKMNTAPEPPVWIRELEPVMQQLIKKHMEQPKAPGFLAVA